MRTATSIPRLYADATGLKHGDLTEKLIGIFFKIHNELGHGFLESVYEQAFSVSLAENGIFFERQIAVPVWFHKQQIGEFRADVGIARSARNYVFENIKKNQRNPRESVEKKFPRSSD